MLRSPSLRATTNSNPSPIPIRCPSNGYLGLYTISVLADLEDRIHAPLATRFDLIAGTSVGGIIAIGIANEVPAASIKDAFERNGTEIFSARHPPRTSVGRFYDVLRCMLKPKYDPSAL